jgi:hypothetical protein
LKKKISSHLGLVETSSVVTHDLSAQLHVMKFCLDELLASGTFPGGEKNEFVEQLRLRTDYVENLLIGYKKLLKMSRDEGNTFTPFDSFKYAKELVRNHYPSYTSRIHFEGLGEEQDTSNTEYIGECSICMHILFVICSCFIEWEIESGKLNTFNFILDLDQSRDDVLGLTIKLPKSCLDEANFLNYVESRSSQKGRVRQWCGLEYFSDLMNSSDEFYLFIDDEEYSSISFKLLVDKV